jgi:hypothetical protein
MRPLLFLLCASISLHAGDWPQYLGPQRDGTAQDEAALTGMPSRKSFGIASSAADTPDLWSSKAG